MKYVGYYRVSTKKQGKSGLGLEAQKQMVETFAEANGDLVAEFVEVESGKNDQRSELSKAMALAKKSGASLLIAKLDRFSRRVSFIAAMMEKGVPLVIAEMPNATDFQLHIFAALAQENQGGACPSQEAGKEAWVEWIDPCREEPDRCESICLGIVGSSRRRVGRPVIQ